MSQLIQMRRRIKTIETIKKVTHAMRLIAMSGHARFKGKESALTFYVKTFVDLFQKVHRYAPQWKNKILQPTHTLTNKHLVIVVTSQKGLCGSFNNALLKLFETYAYGYKQDTTTYAIVGRRGLDYFNRKKIPVTYEYPVFGSRNLLEIATALAHDIFERKTHYTRVTVFSNHAKTFFQQQPIKTELIPATNLETLDLGSEPPEEYIWEQTPHDILDYLVEQYLEASLHHHLFQSLLAEQSARFISMDTATRNANEALDQSKSAYNKLRQAKITKELAEITGSI